MDFPLNFIDQAMHSARRLHSYGQDGRAARVLRKLLQVPELPARLAEEAHVMLAQIALDQQRFRSSRRHLLAAIHSRPDYADYYFLLANALDCDPAASPEHAGKYYRRAIQLDGENAEYWLEYGAYLLRLDKPRGGLAALRRAYALAEQDPEIVGRVAAELREHGAVDEAASKLRACLFRNPRDKAFRALMQQHQFQAARLRQQEAKKPFHELILLPYAGQPTHGKYVTLGEKTIRLDQAEPSIGPKEMRSLRQPNL